MSTAKSFLLKVEEAAAKMVKELRIVDGKKVIVKRKEYIVPCKEGYRRDPETGQCVKMSLKEQRDRSLSASKSANKSSTKRKRNISMRRRSALIKD